MRLTIAKKVHYDAGINLTPLADIAMVILIFFMLVGSFGAEHYLSTNVPLMQIAASAGNAQWLPAEPLDIDVESSGERFVATAGHIKTSDAAVLAKQLTAMRQELQKSGTSPDNVQVIINPTKATRYEHLVRAYDAALQAGFTKVAFSAVRESK